MGAEEKTNEMVVVEIGKYKKIKRALKESEERYRILFENVPLGVYRTTAEGRILDANPAFVKMMGYDTFEELAEINLNQECTLLKYPREKFVSLMGQQGELRGFEVRCVRRDGSPVVLRENAKAIRDEGGHILCYEGTIEDITEKKRMEELVDKRSQELEILNKVILSGNKAVKLQELLEIIIDYVMELLKFDVACIYLINPEEKSASLQVSRGLPASLLRDIQTCAIDAPPYRDIFIQGKSIYANEYFYTLMGTKFSKRKGWLGMAAIPLLAGDKVIGSLHVASHQHHEFHPEDKAILEIIGKETGILISKLLTEHALRESEEFYRQLVETSPDLIALISLDNEIQMANRQFFSAFGFSNESDVCGKKISGFLLAEENARFEQSKRELLREGKASILEFHLVPKSGHPIPFELKASVINDAAGNPKSFIIFGRDITERQLADRELKENEQIFRRTFEAIPDPAYVWLRQESGKIVLYLANTAARQVSQNRIHDHIGLDLEEIYIDHPEIVSRIKEVFAKGKSVNETIFFKDRTGEERWLLVDYVKTAANYILWITKDATGRKQSDEKLQNYQEQLRSLTSALALAEERERRKIALSLHDHIGQQLAFSMMKLEGLAKLNSASELVAPISEIRQMLDQAIEDTRSLIFELSPPILYELGFDKALEWLVEHIQKRLNPEIAFKVESKTGTLDEDMQIMLFQIARELLSNVAKHSRAKNAHVKVKRDSGFIQMEVHDDGRGFNADEFFSTKSISGFGFFSIRERIKHMGGILKVESRDKEGTTIFLKVPLGYNQKG